MTGWWQHGGSRLQNWGTSWAEPVRPAVTPSRSGSCGEEGTVAWLPAVRAAGRIDLVGSAAVKVGSAAVEKEFTTCLVAEGRAVVRTGLRLILESQPEFVVAAEAASGEDAIQAAVSLHPDVVLMDVHLPGLGSARATAQIMGAAEQNGRRAPTVIVLADAADVPDAAEFLRAGALAFVRRAGAPEAVIAAIRAACGGNAVLDPDALIWLMDRRMSSTAPPAVPGPRDIPRGRDLRSLTQREREVLLALAHGRSNRQLAACLGLKETTVKTHVSRVLIKLSLHSRAEAVALAHQLGVVPVPDSLGDAVHPCQPPVAGATFGHQE